MSWDTMDSKQMLHHAAKFLDRKVLCSVLADIAETAAPYLDDKDIIASLWAIDAVRRWCRGEDNLDEVRAASEAAAETNAPETAYYAAVCAYSGNNYLPYFASSAAYSASFLTNVHEEIDRERRSSSLAIYIRLKLPADPMRTKYVLFEGVPVCPENLMSLPDDMKTRWDAACERGLFWF